MKSHFILRYFLLTICALAIFGLKDAHAQNLIFNGDFNLTSTGWITSCSLVEAYGFETTYGGPSSTNHVAEIDDEACMHQDVCVLQGYSYIYSMDASVRTGGGPNPCTSHIKIMGLDITSTVIVTYVDMDYVRTNTVFALTPVTGIPIVTVPVGSGVVRLRVELTDNTPGYSTLGMIIDNLSLTYVAGPGFTGGTISTCQGVGVPFSVAGVPTGLTYNWDFGAGATPATSTVATPTASWSSPGTKIVTVAIGNGACADTVTDTVAVSPSVTVDLFDTTCSNVPFTFRGVAYHVSGVYTDTVTATGGCDSIISLHLYVKPPITFNVDQSICAGTSYGFLGHVYTATGDYTDSLTTPTGCDSLVTLHLTVNPRPPKPTVAPETYCQFFIASPLVATGSSLTWYGPGVTPAYTATPTVVTTTPGIDTFYVTQTVLGCTGDSLQVIIAVKPIPAPPAASDTGYCQYQAAAPLRATGSSLQWYTSSIGGLPLAIAPVPPTLVPGDAHWYVSQTVNGCEGNRTTVTVKVSPVPVFTIGTDRINVCINDTANLSYIGDGNVLSHIWSVAPGGIITSGSVKSPSIGVECTVSGYQYVSLKVTDTAGVCSAIDTIKLKVIPTPTTQINTPNGVCLGDTVTLALGAHSDNADTFYWRIDKTPLQQSADLSVLVSNSNSGGPYSVSWLTAGLHVIDLYTITKEGCPSARVYDSVKVNVPPDAAFTIQARGELCLEDSVFFQALQTVEGDYYLWSPASFFNNLNQPSAWGKMEEQKSVVSLTVTDPFGCASSTSQELDPASCCTIIFPNAFTPNGDTHNNLFRPIVSGYHKFHQFIIANRWGQTVFESASSNFQWDGNYNGVPQDMGVYYYYLSYDCGGNTLVQRGDVTLIR